ncbi:MAG: septum formation initiator family protein [Bryobacteraceae bacterium]|nr:septum formation initiator family protein [Bryobacteraceae bacterium]
MKPLFRKLGWVTLVGMAGVYVYILSTGPRGIPALMEKRRQITAIEDRNASLSRENESQRERIQRLRDDPEELQLEVMKRLKKQRRGTRDFYTEEVRPSPAR